MFFRPLLTMATIRCFAGIYLLMLGMDGVVMAFSRMGKRP